MNTMAEEDNIDLSNELQSLVSEEEDDKSKSMNYLDKLKGFVAGLLLVASVTVSGTCCQLLESRIPDFELNTIRPVISWTLMVVLLMVSRKLPKVEISNMKIICVYSLTSLSISLTVFVSVTMTAISSVECILITSGITSGLLIFRLTLDEKITVMKLFCALLCITGVISVVQPEFLFNTIEVHNTTEMIPTEGENATKTNVIYTVLGSVLPIISGITQSIQTMIVKKFPFIGNDVVVTGFWTLIFGSIISAVLMWSFETPILPQNWMDVLYILVHSLSYGITWSSCIIAAFYLSGNTVNIIFSTTVVSTLVPQYTILSSIYPGHRNWIEVLGAVLVLMGSSLGSVIEPLSTK